MTQSSEQFLTLKLPVFNTMKKVLLFCSCLRELVSHPLCSLCVNMDNSSCLDTCSVIKSICKIQFDHMMHVFCDHHKQTYPELGQLTRHPQELSMLCGQQNLTDFYLNLYFHYISKIEVQLQLKFDFNYSHTLSSVYETLMFTNMQLSYYARKNSPYFGSLFF